MMSISEQNLGAGIGGQLRRRRWSEAQKRQTVPESYQSAASVSVVAWRHGLNTNQLFTWRRRFRDRTPLLGLLDEAGARLEGLRLLNGRFVLKAELGDAAMQILVPSGRAASQLVHEMMEARDEKRLLRLQDQLARVSLLIVDELGYVPLSQTGSELLFDVFSRRYENGATIVTSNLPFQE